MVEQKSLYSFEQEFRLTAPDFASESQGQEFDGAEGIYLKDLSVGDLIEVETKNRSYAFENCGNGQALVSGHPEYCPEPVLVRLQGSTWGGTMLKPGYIGRGMLLEFLHPAFGVVRTSRIQRIRPPNRSQS